MQNELFRPLQLNHDKNIVLGLNGLSNVEVHITEPTLLTSFLVAHLITPVSPQMFDDFFKTICRADCQLLKLFTFFFGKQTLVTPTAFWGNIRIAHQNVVKSSLTPCISHCYWTCVFLL